MPVSRRGFFGLIGAAGGPELSGAFLSARGLEAQFAEAQQQQAGQGQGRGAGAGQGRGGGQGGRAGGAPRATPPPTA